MKRFRLIRYAIYIVVIAALFIARGTGVLDAWKERFSVVEDGRLVLSGAQLAPRLSAVLIASYQRDYPDLELVVRGGGSAHALEDLLHGDADVALLIRIPNRVEHEIFRDATGDTIAYHTIALGGIAFLQNSAQVDSLLEAEELRSLLRGEPTAWFQRIYAPDPNTGLWAALARLLWEEDEAPQSEANVVFLADEGQVMEALLNDPEALGVVSTLSSDLSSMPPGLATVAVRAGPAETGCRPSREEIADGRYPFYHHLYVGLRSGGNAQARKFVTYLTSDSGQRIVERAGYLPQRLVLREVILSKKEVGEK